MINTLLEEGACYKAKREEEEICIVELFKETPEKKKCMRGAMNIETFKLMAVTYKSSHPIYVSTNSTCVSFYGRTISDETNDCDKNKIKYQS